VTTVTTASGATATTVTTTASTTAAIFGIYAGETTDVIRHQDCRCRQDSTDCQSQ
jgi:hypothetical protein